MCIRDRLKATQKEAEDIDRVTRIRMNEFKCKRDKIGDDFVGLKISSKVWRSKLKALEGEKQQYRKYLDTRTDRFKAYLNSLLTAQRKLLKEGAKIGFVPS